MLLDAPFIPDDGYADLLANHAHRLCSVHFSVSSPLLTDARQRMVPGDLLATLTGLNRLDGVDRYVLMNTRLHAPDRYFDQVGLSQTTGLLTTLLDEANLTGIIFADAYFLTVLSDHAPEVMARLEAVPSINCMLDSADKAFAMLSMIKGTAFRLPSRLILDRSLNRNRRHLEDVATRIQKTYPAMQLVLMANEGCLFQCPFKSAHDAHISLVNEGLCGERTFSMNQTFGCVRRMLNDPGTMLASPFIRPEDLSKYEPLVDGIKICGRNRGVDFLKRAVSAYARGEHGGNLLDLMDAMGDMADRVNIPNTKLPADFADRVMRCDKQCDACGWCEGVMRDISEKVDPGLPIFTG